MLNEKKKTFSGAGSLSSGEAGGEVNRKSSRGRLPLFRSACTDLSGARPPGNHYQGPASSL
ncbi:MAG: hypothetical protein ABIQ31_11070 [Ferruginibacter sp.]